MSSNNYHHRPSPFPSCFRPSSAADRGPSTAAPNLTTFMYTTPSPHPISLNHFLKQHFPMSSNNYHHRPSPFPSCFRPSSAADRGPSTAAPNLTTFMYATEFGLFALSWSRSTLFGRSLHLHHHHHYSDIENDQVLFQIHIKPFPWSYGSRRGSKKLNLTGPNKSVPARVFWDLSGAKYGSGPEPVSGFYVAVVVDGEIVLLVGDCDPPKEAYSRREKLQESMLVLRREHVYGTKLYSTKANISGQERTISIDCKMGPDPKLCFSVDGKRALQIKHLKWKFRGNDSIEIDGTCVQVSWDVYNWLFDNHQHDHDYALFMFTVFNQRTELLEQEHEHDFRNGNNSNALFMWSQPQPHHHQQHSFGFGFEEKRMKKKKGGPGLRMRSGRSSSSSSLSSAVSIGSCSSSVMEWANSEDDEFTGHPYSGFSLLVYAWK